MSTDVIFVLDRSGSMYNLATDTINGFNAFVDSQKNKKNKVYLTTVLFDNEYEVLYDQVNVNFIPPITDKEYFVRGTTALLDAVGKTITKFKDRLIPSEKHKVIFVITTDGYENSSKEFNKSAVKQMITDLTEKGVQFLFFGANIDAFAEAGSIGININFVASPSATHIGTHSVYDTLITAVNSYNEKGALPKDWKSEVK
jgi:uncharacterized protein YegL